MVNISNKTKMYDYLYRFAFGNRFKLWRTVDEYLRSGFDGFVGVRFSGSPGAPYKHHLTRDEALLYLSLSGVPGTPIIYECSPDDLIRAQGEVSLEAGGLFYRRSTAKTHMREALKTAEYFQGLRASVILDEDLDGNGNDFLEILSEYRDHVIEFTSYNTLLGELKGKNYVVWEVRSY